MAIVVGGLLTVFAVVLVRIWTVPDRALGDLALIEIEVRSVFSPDPPVLGAYSRFGWRHPGPVAFYLLAVPYRAFGSGAQALSTGALLLNVGWLVWAISLLRRRGTAVLAAFGACLLLMTAGLGVNGIGDAWNVSLTMVPLVLCVIACWGVLCGDRQARLAAATTYVFVIQTHIGVGVVVTPLVIITLATVLMRPDLRDRHRLTRRETAVAVALGFAAVVPLLVDVVRQAPGNAAELLRWSVSHDLDVIGFGRAIRLVGRASSLTFPLRPEPPRFLLWVETDSVGVLPGISIALVAVLGLVAWRRGRREEMLLSCTLSVVWVSGLIAARSILAPPEWWLVQWLQPLGWMTVAAAAVLLWRLKVRQVVGDTRPARSVAIALVAAVVPVALLIELGTIQDFDGRSTIAVEPVDRLTDAVEEVAGDFTVRIETVDPDFSAENMLAGVVNEARRRGVDVCVDPRLGYKFPDDAVCSGGDEVVLLLQSEAAAVAVPDGYVSVAIYDPLSLDVRRRADVTRIALAAALRADGRDDLVGTLDTPLAAEAVLAEPGSSVLVLRDDLLWLDEVRERPGHRFGLYLRSQ